MSHPDGKQMTQDFHYPAQALPAQPTFPNPNGLECSTMRWRLPPREADIHYHREGSEDTYVPTTTTTTTTRLLHPPYSSGPSLRQITTTGKTSRTGQTTLYLTPAGCRALWPRS